MYVASLIEIHQFAKGPLQIPFGGCFDSQNGNTNLHVSNVQP